MTAPVERSVVRCVIVDDEPLARHKLRQLLAAEPRVAIIGEAGDGAEAKRVIESTRPDLLLLDVQMPEIDGFAVLSAVDVSPLPYVIFVTAYDEYAIRAFDVGALDYLLKPVDPDRFATALDRALSQIDGNQRSDVADRVAHALEQLAGRGEHVDRFLVKRGHRSVLLPASEIEWIEADGNYLHLHARSGVFVVRGTMREAAQRLDPSRFVRIHRSSLVNLDCVAHFEPWSHGDQLVVLKSGARLTMSRRYRDHLPPMLRG